MLLIITKTQLFFFNLGKNHGCQKQGGPHRGVKCPTCPTRAHPNSDSSAGRSVGREGVTRSDRPICFDSVGSIRLDPDQGTRNRPNQEILVPNWLINSHVT
eukprot:sb/3478432/